MTMTTKVSLDSADDVLCALLGQSKKRSCQNQLQSQRHAAEVLKSGGGRDRGVLTIHSRLRSSTLTSS